MEERLSADYYRKKPLFAGGSVQIPFGIYCGNQAGELPDRTKQPKRPAIRAAKNADIAVTFTLDRRAYAYWSTEIHDWHVESGEYEIQIGKNAHEILLSETVSVQSETVIPKVFTFNSTMGELMADPKGKAVLEQTMGAMMGPEAQEMAGQAQGDGGVINDEMMAATMEAMPLRQLASFVPGVTKAALEQLLAAVNS